MLFSLIGGVACESFSSEGLGSDPVPIVGGVVHNDLHPSVVWVTGQKPGEAFASQGSGIIVGPITVLTAAHVVPKPPADVFVVAGHVTTGDQALSARRRAARVFVHPGYRPATRERESQHDIAILLLLGEPFPPSSIASLGDPDAHDAQGQSCDFEMVGYGTPYAAGENSTRRAASTCLAPKAFMASTLFRDITAPLFSNKRGEFATTQVEDYFYRRVADGHLRKRDFVASSNGYFRRPAERPRLPSGAPCPGDSGGGIFRAKDGVLMGLISMVVDPLDSCGRPSAQASLSYTVTSAINVIRYTRWIDSITEMIEMGRIDDPDCQPGQDHTCARKGIAEMPSCGYLAAQLFGWKVLHVAPASEYSQSVQADIEPPPLTNEMVQWHSQYPWYVTDQQLINWHSQHGWRLQCLQDATSEPAGQPGWIRLDGYTSGTGFPGTSPVAEGGIWDCQACLMWRGD